MRPKTFDEQEALNSAMIQFWESGFDGSSMQDLVDRMGISRQSLYDTYGNKRELFESSLKRYREEVIEPRIREIADPSVSPTDSVRNYFKSILDGAPGMPIGCLMVRTATEISPDDRDIGVLLDDCVSMVHKAMTGIIERGQASGEFDSTRKPKDLAGSVVAAGMGLQVMRRLPNQGKSMRPSIDTLLRGLGLGAH